jgi:hypothetical protein
MSDEYLVKIPDGQDPNDLRYFFISFGVASGGLGNIILPQKKQTDGKPDNGLNIASVTRHLIERTGNMIIVMSWNETTATRYAQWLEFLAQGPTLFPFFQMLPISLPAKPPLGVIDGGGEKSVAIVSPILHMVKEEDKPITH